MKKIFLFLIQEEKLNHYSNDGKKNWNIKLDVDISTGINLALKSFY